MKKCIYALATICCFCISQLTAQCPQIVCLPDTTLSNDSSVCGAVFSYATPVTYDLCNVDSQIFNYTGSMQTFIVPANIYSITVDIQGAAGGGNINAPAGLGGRLQANYPVTPGQTLEIYVGSVGDVVGTAGWNGGGTGIGGDAGSPGSGGGGASDIRIGGSTFNDRKLVAGGGGGGAENGGIAVGGNGGGLIGADGGFGGNPWGCSPLTMATGGTQSAGGLGGTSTSCAWNGFDGSFGQGGNSHNNYRSSGGGGGWYGGGGAHNGGAGAGGSSYADPMATSVVHTQGYNPNDGVVIISWVNSSSLTLTQITGLASGATFPAGTTINTFVVEDSLGNADTCSFSVTVNDIENPTITVPSNVSSCDSIVNSIAAITSDNCSGETINYYSTGATTISGTGDASGNEFNVGTTTLWYIVTDVAGNKDSSSFDITIHPTSVVSLAAFSSDTICISYAPLLLPTGTPASGVYSGPGISGSMFDPALSGVGNFDIIYTYTDTNNCSNADSSSIVVLGCAGIEEYNQELVIYPNPNNGVFNIELPSGGLITITNLLGSVIYTRELNSGLTNIALENVESGTYFITLQRSNYIDHATIVIKR